MPIIETIIIGVVMTIIASGVAWSMGEYEKRKARRAERSGKLGDTYEFDLMTNSTRNGQMKPVIYGTHRIGGQMIQQFTRQYTEGVDHYFALIGLGWGPLDSVAPNGYAADVHIDGNTSTNYRGLSCDARRGTNDQTVMNDWQTVTTAVAYNNQLVYGTANAIQCAGTANADKALIKVQFVSGMYYVDSDGHRHSTSFWCSTRYRTTAGPGAWSSWTNPSTAPFTTTAPGRFTRRRYEAFSIWVPITFPSNDTYDVEIRRDCADHDGADIVMDSYVKEYQQIDYDDLLYPNTGLLAVAACATDQISGAIPRITCLVRGRNIMGMSSATTFTTPATTPNSNNPALVILDLIHNSNYGAAKYLQPRMDLTLNTVVGGPFTVGEVVLGPDDAAKYRFKGIVRAFSGTSMTVQATQGVPYTNLAGQSSGATANITSVDSNSAIDLTKLWSFHEFCDEQVPDGGDVTTVDANSASGQKVLNVASTTTPAFAAGDSVVINYGGAREESGTIDTVQAGVSITLLANLTYTHTAAQADEVSIAENRMEFDFVFDGDEDLWGAIDRICRCSRAMRCMKGSIIQIRELISETPSQLICEGNINRDSVTISYLPTGDRPNMLDVTYRDKDYDYRKTVAHYEDPTAYTNSEDMIRAEMELYGITRKSQANREIFFRLKRARFTGKLLKFSMGIDHVKFEVGDVFRFAHQDFGFGTSSGMVYSSTNETATLDHDVTLAGGETIRIRHLDGTEETQTLDATTGTARTVTIAAAGTWTTNPAWGTLFAIGTLGRFRVLSIEPGQLGECDIVAEEDDTAYYTDDYGVLPTFTESSLPDPNELPPDVTNLTLAIGTTVNPDTSVNQHIDVHFTKPDHNTYSHAEIYLKELSGQVHVKGTSDRQPGTGNAEFDRPKGVCADGTYVYVADVRNHRIVKLNQNDLSFVANLGSQGVGDGQFTNPYDVCTDGTHIWVADTTNNRIQKLTVAGVFVDKLGTAGAGADQFNNPMGICHDSNTSLICVVDTYNHRMVEIDEDLDGNGGGGTWNTYGAQGAGVDQFERPMGIDTDQSYYYVADTGNDRIKRITLALAHDVTVGTTGSGDDQFDKPEDIAIDGTNELLYVADTQNHRYHRRDGAPSGSLAYVDDIGEEGYGRDQFYYPRGICHHGDFIFIAERGWHQVQIRDDEETENSGWEYKGETRQNNYRIIDEFALGEQYRVSAVSVSPTRVKKDPEDAVTTTIMTRARTDTPSDVTNFTAANAGGYQVVLSWSAVRATDLAGYIIKAGQSWAIGQTIAMADRAAVSFVTQAPPINQSTTYWIAAVTTSQVESATPASVNYTTPYDHRAIGWNQSLP
jgi:hypothetical protein